MHIDRKTRTPGRPGKRSIASFEGGYIEYPPLMTFPRAQTFPLALRCRTVPARTGAKRRCRTEQEARIKKVRELGQWNTPPGVPGGTTFLLSGGNGALLPN
jgi:hypothetical protein